MVTAHGAGRCEILFRRVSVTAEVDQDVPRPECITGRREDETAPNDRPDTPFQCIFSRDGLTGIVNVANLIPHGQAVDRRPLKEDAANPVH
jgi:hypothetical protein